MTFSSAVVAETTTNPLTVAAATRGREDAGGVEEENHSGEERHHGSAPNRERLTALAADPQHPGSINGETPIAVVTGGQGRVNNGDGPQTRGGEGPYTVAGEDPLTNGAQRKEGQKPPPLMRETIQTRVLLTRFEQRARSIYQHIYKECHRLFYCFSEQ